MCHQIRVKTDETCKYSSLPMWNGSCLGKHVILLEVHVAAERYNASQNKVRGTFLGCRHGDTRFRSNVGQGIYTSRRVSTTRRYSSRNPGILPLERGRTAVGIRYKFGEWAADTWALAGTLTVRQQLTDDCSQPRDDLRRTKTLLTDNHERILAM